MQQHLQQEAPTRRTQRRRQRRRKVDSPLQSHLRLGSAALTPTMRRRTRPSRRLCATTRQPPIACGPVVRRAWQAWPRRLLLESNELLSAPRLWDAAVRPSDRPALPMATLRLPRAQLTQRFRASMSPPRARLAASALRLPATQQTRPLRAAQVPATASASSTLRAADVPPKKSHQHTPPPPPTRGVARASTSSASPPPRPRTSAGQRAQQVARAP